MGRKYVSFFQVFGLICFTQFAFAQAKITQKGDTLVRGEMSTNLKTYTEEYFYKEKLFQVRQYKFTKKGKKYLLAIAPIRNNKYHGKVVLYNEQGKPANIVWEWKNGDLMAIYKYYANGQLKQCYRYFVEPSIRHGEFVYYHPNGQLEAKGRFEKDKMVGVYQEWDKRGRLEVKAQLKNGLEEDTTKVYKKGRLKYAYIANLNGLYHTKLIYKSKGQLKKKVHFDFSDKESLPRTLYYWKTYPIDTIKNLYNNKGKRQGYWLKENLPQQRYEVVHYENGVPQGPCYFYALNGVAILFRGRVNNGKIEGLAKGYRDLKDDVVDSLYFKDGKLERMKLFYPKVDICFKNGVQEGVYMHPYYFRALLVRVPIIRGKLHGNLQIFNKDKKQLLFEGQLKDNQWTKDTLKLYNTKGQCVKGYIHKDKLTYRAFVYQPDGSVKDQGEKVLSIDNDRHFIAIYRDLLEFELRLFKAFYKKYNFEKTWFVDD